MAIRSYIPIEKDNIPELFEIGLGSQPYLFGINYAEAEDLYSVDLYDIEGEPIVLGERLVLNQRLWADIIDDRIPSVDLVPMDESSMTKEITGSNFYQTVFIYFDDLADDTDTPSLDREAEI